MLLAVLLATTTYSGTPDALKRKEALVPTGSRDVRAESSYASNDRSWIADILERNNYTQNLYGYKLQTPKWINELTVFYPGMLDPEDQQAVAKRAKTRSEMCPTSVANGGEILCWMQKWDQNAGIFFRTMRSGITRVLPDTLVNVGDDSQTWITSKYGHLAAGGNAKNTAVRDYQWAEVLHCATPHEQGHQGKDGAWFYVVKGSGVSLNVGKTIEISEWDLERHGISPPMQSADLAMFWSDVTTNLTEHLGLTYGERSTYDSIQRVDHHEVGDQPMYHELILNPKYLQEHQHMFEANDGVIRCGAYPKLTECSHAHATEAQLTAVSRTCGA